jgi:ferredoxin-NADP reductase
VASGYLHEHLRPGDVIEAAAPRGGFVLRDGARPVVLISAGVGATPVLAMLYRLAAARDPRPVWWLQAARNGAEHAFAGEVDRLLARLPDGHGRLYYSRPEPGDVCDVVGHISAEAIADTRVAADADCYICGPDAFMRSLSAGLAARGTPPEQIAVELFGAAAVIAPPGMRGEHPTPHAPKASHGTGPAVTFSRSGLTVPWDEEFGNLLDFAEACDVPVSFSCRNGVCHYCESGLLSGAVDYVIDPLQAPQPDRVLVCCTVPTEALTLEL